MSLNWFGLPLIIAFTELMIFGISIGIIAMSVWSIGYLIAVIKETKK